MLLPSSIQRAADLVGIATPTVGLPWAMASRSDTVAARPASARASKVVFNLNLLHSLGFLSWGTVALDSVNRRLSFVGWPQIYGDVGSAPGPGASRTEIAECRLNPSTAPCSLR